MIFYVLLTVVSGLVTWGLSIVIYKLSHRFHWYPKIRERDVHTRPTPRLGGVAMFLGIVVAIGIASQIPQLSLVFSEDRKIWAILAAALIIVVVGVVDDIFDLDWLTKLAGQIIAAGVLVWGGVQILSLPIGGILLVSSFPSLVITVFLVVLVMNAVNFIDGLDGLVAGVAIIANGVFFIYSYLLQSNGSTEYFNLASLITAALIGACLGFLPLNFHPAKLFMGDAGALLVGLLMAVSAISVTGEVDPSAVDANQFGRGDLFPAFIPILLPLAILVIPLLDFGLAVMRRLHAGKSPFSADRLHLHHRLLDMGHSHLHAVLIFYAWTAVVAVGCLAFMFVPWYWAVAFIVVGLAVSAVFTLAPLSRRKRVEAAAQSAKSSASPVAPQMARLDPLDVASVDPLDPQKGVAS
ncbi:MraY family glycosyltransferase [Glaciihabitans sp. dw_435]|uniref:MraY family glycosyltransferase n=1 Tax=Glaciihabitans sp. dw_435 TaxID=2720081 RepID=UPI001BD376C5|nr:MraY family glycosyltransferase [Glaciihabitans sp. dw_435]